MRILQHSDALGWTLNGAAISESELCALDVPAYGMDIIEPLAEVGPAVADALERGSIIDLAVAASMYDASTGNTAKHGDIEDTEWLAHRVPREALLQMQRGMVALRAAQNNGVPVSRRNCAAAIDNLLKAGSSIADELEAYSPAIWETRDGEVQTSPRGLPLLSDNVTRYAAVEAIAKLHGVAVDRSTPLARLHDTYPDVTFLELVVRYKRILRDLQRMAHIVKRGDGRLYFERCGIDSNGLSVFRSPNISERAVRSAIESSSSMTLVDMGELELEIAKRVARRNNKPIWDDTQTCAQLGRAANPASKAHTTLERLGREILRGAVCNDSVMAVAHRFYGGRVGGERFARMRQYLQRVLPLNTDPWETEVVARVRRNLLAESSNVDKDSLDLISDVLRFGNRRFAPMPAEAVAGVWQMLTDECQEPELRARLSTRKHGVDVHYSVFCDRGCTWNGRVLHCCSRGAAGMWSVYGTMHDVMREAMWLIWRNGGKPLAYHGAQLLAENIDSFVCMRFAASAQERVLGGVWFQPEASDVRRWR